MSQEVYKSHYFEDLISKVRSIPKSEGEKRANGLMRLRNEAFLANAQLIKKLFEIIEENPEISRDDLIRYTNDELIVTRPDYAEALIDEIISTRDAVRAVTDTAKKYLPQDQDNLLLGETLFQAIIPYENQHVRLDNKKNEYIPYPLSIVLVITSFSNIRLINGGGNATSYFNPRVEFHFNNSADMRKKVAPIIILNEFNSDTLEHEITHGNNRMLRNSLVGHDESRLLGRHYQVWGSWSSMERSRVVFAKLKENIEKLVDNDNRVLTLIIPKKLRKSLRSIFDPSKYMSYEVTEEVTSSHEFREIINFILSLAKEEILAEMSNNFPDIARRLNDLKSKSGGYDYFTQHLRIPKSWRLHDIFWQKYVQQLEKHTALAEELFMFYGSSDFWSPRQKLFRFILMQWPVHQWNEQLLRSGLIAEMEIYQEITSHPVVSNLKLHHSVLTNSLTDDENRLANQILKLLDILYAENSTGTDTYVLGFLREQKKAFDTVFEEKYMNSSLKRKVDLYADFVRIKHKIYEFYRMLFENEFFRYRINMSDGETSELVLLLDKFIEETDEYHIQLSQIRMNPEKQLEISEIEQYTNRVYQMWQEVEEKHPLATSHFENANS